MGEIGEKFVTKISESLLTQAEDQLAGAAMTSALNFIGISSTDSNDQIQQKLDIIIAKLDGLKKDVEDLKILMQAELNQIDYDILFDRLDKIIATTQTIQDYHQALLFETNIDSKNNTLSDLNNQFDADYKSGLNTFHEVIMGIGGKTSLLDAWNKACVSKRKGFVGVDFSYDIQKQWDFLDAYQALIANFLAYYYLYNKEFEMAKNVYDKWRNNRVLQLQKLRGSAFSNDTVTMITVDKDRKLNLETIVTQISAWGDVKQLYVNVNGEWIGWSRSSTPLQNHELPYWWDVKDLLFAPMGIGWDRPVFSQAMRDRGFQYDVRFNALNIRDGDENICLLVDGIGVAYAAGCWPDTCKLYGKITPENKFWVD